MNHLQTIAATQKVMRLSRFIRAKALAFLIIEFPASCMNPGQPLHSGQPHGILVHRQRGGDYDFTGWRAYRQSEVLDAFPYDAHINAADLHDLP